MTNSYNLIKKIVYWGGTTVGVFKVFWTRSAWPGSRQRQRRNYKLDYDTIVFEVREWKGVFALAPQVTFQEVDDLFDCLKKRFSCYSYTFKCRNNKFQIFKTKNLKILIGYNENIGLVLFTLRRKFF